MLNNGGKEKYLNYAVYGITAIIGFALLLWYYAIGDNALKVLLWPHAAAASAVFNIPMQYVDGTGYTAPNGAFAIGRECMGMNFIVLQFCMLACVFVKRFTRWKKALWLLTAFTASVLTGLAVSCMRIIGSIPFAAHEKFSTIHTGIGITLYFTALIASFFVARKMLGVIHYEKP